MENLKKSVPIKMATMTSLALPVTLITSVNKDGKPNILVITYVTGVNEEPAMFGIAIRQGKYSNFLIKQTREFVINVPTLDLIKEIDYCGTYTGKVVNKFQELGLTPVKAKKVKPPLIGECPINLECKLEKIVKLPSHDLFIGKVVALNVDKKVLEKEKNKYGVYLAKYGLIKCLFTTFLDYRAIGEKKGVAFEEHKKLGKRRKICQ